MIDDDAETLPDEDEDSAVGEGSPPMTRTATSAAKPRTARKRRAKKATKPAGKAKKAKAGKGKAKEAKGSKKAKTAKAVPPRGLVGVKAGGHVLWVARAVARSLNAKDRKKLRAVLKRAEKRAKSAK
jgi:hypothetical protein